MALTRFTSSSSLSAPIVTDPAASRPGLVFDRYFTTEGVDPFDTVEWERRDAVITGADGSVVFEQRSVEFPKSWSQSATNIVVQKYFRGTLGTDKREKSARSMIGRVADTIHGWGVSGKYFRSEKDGLIFRDELVHLLLHQKMAFNSPVWFNVGVEARPQCSACFINSVEDSMDSVLDLAKTEGMLFKYGSGTGSNLSTLRGSCENLRGGGTASGPVSFMRGFDAFAGAVKSGGKTRRAAKMVILNIDHPDVVDFIECKAREEKKAHSLIDAGYDGGFDVPGGAYDTVGYQNANHSVRVTDDFMQAVQRDSEWSTRAVKDGRKIDTFRAKALMGKIAEAAWTCGDPGLQYDTTINDWHTCIDTGRINASNPCVTGDTLVATRDGLVRIDALVGKEVDVVAGDGDLSRIKGSFKTGTKDVYLLKTKSGYTLKVTADHKISTLNRGDVAASELTEVDAIQIVGALDFWRADGELKIEAFGIAYARRKTDTLESFTLLGLEDVYDLTEPRTNHFVANGIVVHNCSEYMFLDNSACNLASLNLRRFQDTAGDLDVDSFRHAIATTITAMEVIVDNSSYPTPRITANSKAYRPLGLGYANLGAMLMSRSLPYDSEAGRAYAAAVTALMCGEAYLQSARIAAEATGPFDGYDRNEASFIRVMRKHRSAVEQIDGRHVPQGLVSAARHSWDNAIELGQRYGYRNGQATVLAPTGTIGFLMDCDTTGVEPDIALVKYKRLVGGGVFKIVNGTVPEALRQLGYDQAQVESIVKHIDEKDTIESAPHLKPEDLPVFDCAFRPKTGTRSIHYMGHVRMMGAVQPFLSGAISKTVNMPSDCTVADIEDAYVQAWKLGLKAIAVFRDGCKRTQPLSTSLVQAKSKGHASDLTSEERALIEALRARKNRPAGPPTATRCKLPNDRNSHTHKFSIGGHEGYVTVGMYEDGSPGEIFVRMAKEGSAIAGLMDSFATAVSIALQHGVPLPSLIEKFKGTRFEPSGYTGNQEIPLATSIMDYLFRWLAVRFPADGGSRFTRHSATTQLDLPKVPVLAAEQSGRGLVGEQPAPVAIAVVEGPRDQAWVTESNAPPCHECGALMVRNGACYKCQNCGATSGCS